MKIIRILSILFLSLLVIPACDESESVVTGVEGGLLEILDASVNYVVGNSGPYTSRITVYQGETKTTKVEVYKSFHTTVPAPTDDDTTAVKSVTSNEVLFKTIDITNTSENTIESISFSLGDLIEGLTVEGNPLPASDGEYQIGDTWELKYASTTDDGRVVFQNKSTSITVATRFAGKYKCVDAVYGRYTGTIEWFYTEADWPSETIIQSVDAITYKVLEYFGPFDGNEWYFQVDPTTLEISYPLEWKGVAQTGNGQEFITCGTNPNDFAIMGLDCTNTSNVVVLDDVNGKDKLYMTFGYYTTGSGPRTFYQVMEKIVE